VGILRKLSVTDDFCAGFEAANGGSALTEAILISTASMTTG